MNTETKIISFLQFQLPAIAWCLFIFVASSIPMAKLPSLENYSDKVVHAGVFFMFCWLSHIAFFHQTNASIKKYSLLIAFSLTVLYGFLDEYHQSYTPGRQPDQYDLVADAFGGLMYVLLYLRFKFYDNE